MRSTKSLGEYGVLGLLATLMQSALADTVAPVRRSGPRRMGLFDRFDRWSARQGRRERERYLSQSQDVFELESRMRSMGRRD